MIILLFDVLMTVNAKTTGLWQWRGVVLLDTLHFSVLKTEAVDRSETFAPLHENPRCLSQYTV
jgi:hypothetical protein